MQRPMMQSWYTTWPPESNLILKIVDSMSNESPNKVLQDAHAYYCAKLPYRRRILVCRSSHAAAVHSWTSKSATPSKASWSQFESVNNGWHLKQKPWPSPSIFMYILLPLNEQVIVQQGSEGRKRRPQMKKRITLKSREGQPSNTNWPWLRRWAYQTIPLLIVFTIRTYICESLDKIVENTGPPAPNCRPLGHVKNIYKTHTVWAIGPKISLFTAASISNESSSRITHNSYSHLL